MTDFEKAKFVLEKIANWDPEFHCMTEAESFRCCQNLARNFVNMNEIVKDDNVIITNRFKEV